MIKWFIIALMLASSLVKAETLQKESINFGIFAYRPKPIMHERFDPIAEYLNKHLSKYHLNMHYFTMDEMYQALDQNKIDIVMTTPTQYIKLRHNNIPASTFATIIRHKDGVNLSTLGGVIVTKSDRDDINVLNDVIGKKIATPGKRYFGGYSVQAYEFYEIGIDLQETTTTIETDAHDKAMNKLLNNEADVAFVRTGIVEAFIEEKKVKTSDLKIINQQSIKGYPYLLSTRLYPEWPLIALPYVDNNFLREFSALLFQLTSDNLALKNSDIAGFIPPKEYLSVESILKALRLEPFDKVDNFTLSDIINKYRYELITAALIFVLLTLLFILLFKKNIQLQTSRNENRQLLKELQEEKIRFLLAIDGAQDGLWDWDLQTDKVFLTERFETMLGYNVGDLPQNIEAWFELLHPDDKEKASKGIKEYLDRKGKGSTYENTFRLRAKDGSWRWILGRGKAQFDTDGRPLRFVGFNTDITDQIEYQEKLDHTAKHDSLTHLPNRFLLSELLTQAMNVVKRKNQHLALLFIDLDGFKEINDTYGHDAGDEVLSIITHRMNSIVRDSDIVSRLGGDEFVVVASELKNSSEVIPMLQRILSDLSVDISYNGKNMNISASIGVSFYPQAEDIGNEVLIRQADQAMYKAKLLGKSQYQFFNLESSQELKEQQQNILNLREAIKREEFVLYYQPKVNMTNNKVIGFEALLRWNHPEDGFLYPDSFLPLVEHESSFMIELGQWVFKSAFAQLESWHKDGLDFTLSINVSSHEVKQDIFSIYLKELLAKHPGIEPNTVEIELLETSAFDNFELTSNTLRECQELGISIAIDDFGTGYASLHYLKKLPMNTLKIDKSFVIDLLTTSQNISIVEASIGLAHAFNSHVVAEGVESEEHGKILLQLGCEIAQGYVISKAMPAQDVAEWIRSWRGFPSWEKIKPISADNRTILHTAIEYRNWIDSIEAFLQNKSSKLPKLNSSNCYLGNWLLHGASKEQRNHPAFEPLNRLHNKLHEHAKKLLLPGKDNKLLEIEKVRELHHKIVQKLDELILG